MILFNIILLIHFAAFLVYVCKLVNLLARPGAPKDKQGLVLGIIILVTGFILVGMKYPAINYYKVVPKLGLFLAVTVINVMNGNKPESRKQLFWLLGLTVAAALIAVVKVA
ncbi:MAG TPA: hypothetical protein VM802_22795 [Chitinophaga sp.]|uniref:hypothetical protein n=1 Tax=Chitinophaga sp. TaxID=1869181 RepID=UPI002D02E97E|nr:hypothetical protein [Chitinophaga sp.]HVI47718.1 hypothetical protein [Chitinophaga sp.]